MLLANLGTPSEPSAAAVRLFLRDLLSDPRLIPTPRWQWSLILNLFILPFRPGAVAKVYRSIWRDGSPLLNASRELCDALAGALRLHSPQVHVALGMRYGSPSIRDAAHELRRAGCARVLLVPLFPQYSGTTVGSVFAAVAAELGAWRVVPELRTIHGYHDDPAYIAAIVDSIRDAWASGGAPQKLLFSFHSLPHAHVLAGDPYYFQCRATVERVAGALGLSAERYDVSFHSAFGRGGWLTPVTANKVRELAQAGVTDLDVICPGFSVDCLETLWDIEQLCNAEFLANGGARFRYIPCLNARPEHARALATLIRRNLAGWLTTPAERNGHNAAARKVAAGAGSAFEAVREPQRRSIP